MKFTLNFFNLLTVFVGRKKDERMKIYNENLNCYYTPFSISELSPKYCYRIPKEILSQSIPSEHIVPVICALQNHLSLYGNVTYSRNYLLNWFGYKPSEDRHKGAITIQTKYLNCMQWLKDQEYIESFDESNFRTDKFNESYVDVDKLYPNKNYGILYDFEVELIKNIDFNKKHGINNSLVLIFLAYLRSYSWNRANLERSYLSHSKKSRQEKPEIFHSTYKSMSSFLGLSERTIVKLTGLLTDLGIIRTYRFPKYKGSSSKCHYGEIIYVFTYKFQYLNGEYSLCDGYDPEQEIKNGIKFIQENQYETKKFNQQ